MSNTIKPTYKDPFKVRSTIDTKLGKIDYFSLPKLTEQGIANLKDLPYSIRILLEAVLRQIDDFVIEESNLKDIATWDAKAKKTSELPFKPARVVMQDFTGVPGVVDLAAMRDAMKDLGKDPQMINPDLPVALVIDHSVQLDQTGSSSAFKFNNDKEFERNGERYEFLRWGSQAFDNFEVVPPSTGIIHQVNLEYLANVVQTREDSEGNKVAFPDSLVGTDSHTTMINALGVTGWGVGGIEAEAVMLGQPVYMLTPDVVGFKLTGELAKGTTATDLVLMIVQKLREHGVVGKFVEFFGPGLKSLSLADRATIANMAPEYGATMGFFAVDEETINYLKLTGRSDEQVDLVEKYCKAQGLFREYDEADPTYTSNLEFDMSQVIPSISGPKRPQDRITLADGKSQFFKDLNGTLGEKVTTLNDNEVAKAIAGNSTYDKKAQSARIPLYNDSQVKVNANGKEDTIEHGSIVIASITSCTNTSNPSVIIGAGLLAQKAAQLGLSVKPHVKTSLAPGSKVVTRYLEAAKLIDPLETLGFNVVGYGCATCIGNSGPIDINLSKAIQDNKLVATSVLSGNRNFEGRIHPDVRANYLASPPLVVAYAIAGTVDIDFDVEPLGFDKADKPVYLSDVWPSQNEISEVLAKSVTNKLFKEEYADVANSNEDWNKIKVTGGAIYDWQEKSTYIRKPSFFDGITLDVPDIKPINNARVLAFMGDSVTTDHISPAGNIPGDSPAATWMMDRGVEQKDFNSYGSRRGNHEVMMRGTFGNIRIKNLLVPGTEGGYSIHLPTNTEGSMYDVAEMYRKENTPLVVIAGKEYGTGSSRDWAAKGTILLGIKAVITESYERIHRSNLIGMGVLPLQFKEGESSTSLGLNGKETISIPDLSNDLTPGAEIKVVATTEDGKEIIFNTIARVDTPVEVQYYQNQGILHTVLRKFGAL